VTTSAGVFTALVLVLAGATVGVLSILAGLGWIVARLFRAGQKARVASAAKAAAPEVKPDPHPLRVPVLCITPETTTDDFAQQIAAAVRYHREQRAIDAAATAAVTTWPPKGDAPKADS
jgi:hypothetical protein